QEIYKDRQKFSDQVFRVASSDLVNMGISVVSYTLKDVHDEQVPHLGTPGGTWAQLGAPGHSWGHLGGPKTHLGHVWGGWGGPDVTQVGHTCDRCDPGQAIAAQRGEVALVERAQRVQLQEQEVGRRRQELEATVRKPAEAERYRLERLAEAHR
ncbi:FLOT1 protein, partial [Panurus biarmicus]|nr:FLOT1 protein [Panurus biarmicus]